MKPSFIIFVSAFLCFPITSLSIVNEDSHVMKDLILNVFEAKRKLEASELLRAGKFEEPILSDVKKRLISGGASADVDKMQNAYKAAITAIKERKEDFQNHYLIIESSLDSIQTSPVASGTSETYFYEFLNPISSFIDRDAMMTYNDFVRIIKHFIIDLGSEKLPSLSEARDFLGNRSD